MLKKKKTVVIGMSGGVDSSVAALLLKNQKYKVIGMFMKNWEEDENCPAQKDYEDALQICNQLAIPLYSVNFAKEYKEQVFNYFLKEYSLGRTPNPDILCNREIKFKLFFEKAKSIGADFIATGHWAKIEKKKDKYFLLKSPDLSKDQSYFLYTLNQDILKETIFPLANLTKKEIRQIAKENNLITASKKDSTGICFIGKRDFRPFLAKFLKPKKGNIETLDGKVVGRHEGASFYTLGQRKGLCIGGEGDAWFVVDKDIKKNKLIVAQGKNHPALFTDALTANSLSFITDIPKAPFTCTAKVRYRQEDQKCIVEKLDQDTAHVQFLSPQRAVTPGQSIVFYLGDICLGGGIIQKVGANYYQKQNL